MSEVKAGRTLGQLVRTLEARGQLRSLLLRRRAG
jgi:hypothetical protein